MNPLTAEEIDLHLDNLNKIRAELVKMPFHMGTEKQVWIHDLYEFLNNEITTAKNRRLQFGEAKKQ